MDSKKRMTLIQIQVRTRTRLLDMRSLEYLINTERFERAYDEAIDEQYNLIIYYIKNNYTIELRKIIKEILSKDLEEKSIVELRKIASDYNIVNYNKLDKISLIIIIKRRSIK